MRRVLSGNKTTHNWYNWRHLKFAGWSPKYSMKHQIKENHQFLINRLAFLYYLWMKFMRIRLIQSNNERRNQINTQLNLWKKIEWDESVRINKGQGEEDKGEEVEKGRKEKRFL